LKTTNGGLTWDSNFTNNSNGVRGVSISQGKYFSFGFNGSLFKSNDGINWENLRSSVTFYNLNKIVFANQLSGYIVGKGGTILKTIDGGNTWNSQISNLSAEITDIEIPNINDAYAISGGSVSKTTNGGAEWQAVNLSSTYSLNSVKFIDQYTGFITGAYTYGQFGQYHSGRLYKTTNSGITWSAVKNDNFYYFEIDFIDDNIGFLTCEPASGNSTVYKTTDGGLSWSPINVQGNYVLTRIYFINNTTGFMGGRINDQWATYALIKTTNQGTDWTYVNLDASYDMEVKSIFFNNPLKGYVTTVSYPDYGRGGDIFETNDGGNNWTHISSNSKLPTIQRQGLNSVDFINQNTGFIVGENGLILKTTTGGSVFVSQISSETPEHFSLHQNYPNPFNPSTVIRYQLSVAGFTTLKVFDLLGKEVATLVHEKQNAGSYAVDFNSTEYILPSGIYFYTLNAGDFKETRKMILVK
jgi:photosystem II stability/assembly factor-like uncharacterized protein